MRADVEYVEAAHAYAVDIAEGVIPACKWTKLQAQRWLDDLDKIGSKGFRYALDVEKAGHACSFIEELPLTKGGSASNPRMFRLEPWQIFLVVSVFGWVDAKTGFRRYREVYLKIPRKNGKSELAAAIAIYMAFCLDEQAAEVFCGGRNERQAGKVWGAARIMLRRAKKLSEALGVRIFKEVLLCEETESTIKMLVGDPEDGDNPYLYVCDEYHEHRTNAQFETMESGMGARDEPLILVTTTAGKQTSPCYRYEQEARLALQGLTQRDDLFVLIYGVDRGDDLYAEETLRKANPSVDVIIKIDELLRKAEKARNAPRLRATYKAKHLNIWVGDEDGFFPVEGFEDGATERLQLVHRQPDGSIRRKTIEEIAALFEGRPVWFGFDGAPKRDFTALCMWSPNKEGGYDAVFRLWLPQATIDQYPEGMGIKDWALEGHIQASEGSLIDFDEVELEIWELWRRVDARVFAFDSAHGYQVVKGLMKRGVNCLEFPQSPREMNMPMNLAEAWMAEGKIANDNNPAVIWQMGNVVGQFNKAMQRPSSNTDEDKIDAPVAMLMAIAAQQDQGDEIDDWSIRRVA